MPKNIDLLLLKLRHRELALYFISKEERFLVKIYE